MNALDLLKERGFVKQITFEDELYKAFDEGMVSFYVGFDPTADSLHIGHSIPIMPVPPPISAKGLWPAFCRCAMAMIGI